MLVSKAHSYEVAFGEDVAVSIEGDITEAQTFMKAQVRQVSSESECFLLTMRAGNCCPSDTWSRRKEKKVIPP